MESEKIIIIRPFAYIKIFDDDGLVKKNVKCGIKTKKRTYEVKKIFWRFYFVRKSFF